MKLLFTYTLLLVTGALLAQSFTITGNVQGTTAKKAYIHYQTGADERHSDSAIITNGKFKITGNITTATAATIVLGNFIEEFFFEPGNTNITGSVSNRKLVYSGSPSTVLFNKFKNQIAAYISERDSISLVIANEKLSPETQGTLQQRHTELAGMDGTLARKIIAENPNSVVSAYLVYRYFTDDKNLLTGSALIKNLSHEAQQSIYAQMVKAKVAKARNGFEGKPFAHFLIKDETGNILSTQNFLGKYVLIDFWASWCGPCRSQNPYLVEAYKKYKDMGFEIVGVSSDHDKQQWIKAIQEDSIEWINGIPVEYGDKSPFKVYDVRFIPTNYLVDPTGIVIAKNLRGAVIEQKLAELLEPANK